MQVIHLRAVLPVAALAFFAACSRDADTATADSADSARDVTVVVDSATQPQLKDVPVSPPASSPSRPKSTPPRTQPPASSPAPAPAPAPVTPAPTPTTGVIASGTSLALTSNSKICTNTNKIGDRFDATLTTPVSGSNGVSLPAGATVNIEVTELKRSTDSKTNIVMGFRVVSISSGGRTYTPDAEVVSASIDRVRSQDRGDDAKKVATGAAAGAIIGQVLGRNTKGTLIGAAVGAAAGAAAASSTSDYEGCVNAGGSIAVRLTGPLTVTAVGN
ncbi:MAG TPA: YMGG-like glycine zipper-containing protein [Gemmatimonadaceae bacterium]